MNTEITDITVGLNQPPPPPDAKGCLLYDGDCEFCLGLAQRFGRRLRRLGFGIAPVHGGPVEMQLLKPDGTKLGGADALIDLARRIWWARPLWIVAQVPRVRPLLRAVYRWVARHRYCLGGKCQLRAAGAAPGKLDWVIAGISGLLAAGVIWVIFSLRSKWPAWVFMWALALVLFAACKSVTWWKAVKPGGESDHGYSPVPARATERKCAGDSKYFHATVPAATTAQSSSICCLRSLGYLFAWPGMDAKAFLAHAVPPRPAKAEWLLACLKVSFGGMLVWGVLRMLPRQAPLLRGWVGMVGSVFLLHFGIFHWLSLAWRRAGVDAQPIMRAPMLATSVGEFWGQRWNLAFHQLVHQFVFRPLRRKIGLTPAMLSVFLLSGLVHESVISLPANGGYGLPTIYFLLQGLAVLCERTPIARVFRLGRNWRGCLWTLLWTAGPAGLLFHSPFINKVMLPFFQTLGAF